MSNWPKESLGELVSLEYGKALKAEERSENGRFPVYGSNGIVGTHDHALVKEPTIVVGRKGAIGEAHLAQNGCWPIDTAFYTVFRKPGMVTLRYLLIWFHSVDLKSLAITATVPGLNRNTLYGQQVPVPPLAEQERIVKMLDEVDELRKVRAQADCRTADLIPSLFHEMFGDPMTNRFGLPVQELGSLCEVVGGGTPSKKRPSYWTGNIPWVSPKDMSGEEVHDSTDHISEQAVNESATNLIPAGSILVVTRSGILKHTLPVAVNSVPAAINQDIKAFIPTGECAGTFLATQLRVLAPVILRMVRVGATVQNLQTDSLRRISVLNPPLTLQKEFAHRVTEFRELEAEQAACRHRLDELFQSLLYRAFNGEL